MHTNSSAYLSYALTTLRRKIKFLKKNLLLVVFYLYITWINSESKFIKNITKTMSVTDPITFRLPKKYHCLAEEYLLKSKERNLNILSQKLLIAEIAKSGIESNNSVPNFNDENAQFLLAALGNSRELFLRVFEILFAGADAKNQFENVIKELQEDWSVINEMFADRTVSKNDPSAIFSDEISTEIDNLFKTQFINSAEEKFKATPAGEAENIPMKSFKQASLFE